jgi:hypothetical protein
VQVVYVLCRFFRACVTRRRRQPEKVSISAFPAAA